MMDRKLLHKKHYLYSHGVNIRVEPKSSQEMEWRVENGIWKESRTRAEEDERKNITFSFSVFFAESIESEANKNEWHEADEKKARETITHWQELMV